MAGFPKIIPISDLRQDAAAVVRRVQSGHHPVVVTQRGRAAAVMVGFEDYERAQQERQILLMLARGEKEIAAGIGHDLDSVLAEADEVVRASRP
jgi:prevent-host-death family protein